MPRDTQSLVEAPLDPGVPSLELLRDILAVGEGHPLWPEGFVWDYNDCTKCAMGLAGTLLVGIPVTSIHESLMWTEKIYAMRWQDVHRIFMSEGGGGGITPQHVAAAITAYLERRD